MLSGIGSLTPHADWLALTLTVLEEQSMKSKKMIHIVASVTVLVFCFGISGLAQSLMKAEQPIAAIAADSAEIRFQPRVEYARLILRVSTPGGEVFSKEFEAGTVPAFKLLDENGSKLADGNYVYELRVTPRLNQEVREALAAARAKGDDQAVKDLERSGKLATEAVQSGSFSVKDGAAYVGGIEEPRTPGDANVSLQSAGKKKSGSTTVTPLDVVTPDDIIVQGSACIGLDCVNNESFGFDTIRLKENNTRIKFEDTSVGTFPTTDWQLTANDSASGGASKFSIEDITGSKVPFTVTAGAPTNSMFVASNGKVGFRTATPALDLHITTTDTPAHRLEQTSGGGFTAQTWDVAGNEANFFVRDVTGGSRLPFRIRPGAPTSSVDIAASGNVGIGTSSPADKMEVTGQLRVSGSGGGFLAAPRDGSGASHVWYNPTGDDMRLFNTINGDVITVLNNGNTGIGTTTPGGKLDVNGSIFQRGAQLFADYVFEPAYIIESIEEHADFMWNNKHLPAVGARAVDEHGQEVVEIGARMRGLLEELEKAHIYISTLNDRIGNRDAQLAKLEQRNAELADRLARIEAMLTLVKTEKK